MNVLVLGVGGNVSLPDDPCDYLDWDSAFFSRRIARVRATRLSRETLPRVLAWCARQRIDCLYFLAESGHDESVRMAEETGFQLVDVRVTLEHRLSGIRSQDERDSLVFVRESQPGDVSVLRAIARISHRDTRFYHDPNFPSARCDALYETWIERSCQGYADRVFVAEAGGWPVGYIACHLDNDTDGRIGLLAVGEHARGRGAGRDLVRECLRWLARHGRTRVTVVTQGRNVGAQRFYQKCGFVTVGVNLWYHHWLHPSRAV